MWLLDASFGGSKNFSFCFLTGKSVYSVAKNEDAIKTEIYRNGPVQGSMALFMDIYAYKSGKVYVKSDVWLEFWVWGKGMLI